MEDKSRKNLCVARNGSKIRNNNPPWATKEANNVLTGNTVRRCSTRIKEARKSEWRAVNTNANVQKQIMAIECIRFRQYRTARCKRVIEDFTVFIRLTISRHTAGQTSAKNVAANT